MRRKALTVAALAGAFALANCAPVTPPDYEVCYTDNCADPVDIEIVGNFTRTDTPKK